VRRDDNLTTLMCRFSLNLEALISCHGNALPLLQQNNRCLLLLITIILSGISARISISVNTQATQCVRHCAFSIYVFQTKEISEVTTEHRLLTHVNKWTFNLKIFLGIDQFRHFLLGRTVVAQPFEIIGYNSHCSSLQCRRLVMERHVEQTALFAKLALAPGEAYMRLQAKHAVVRQARPL
jgi:hypothetical protein